MMRRRRSCTESLDEETAGERLSASMDWSHGIQSRHTGGSETASLPLGEARDVKIRSGRSAGCCWALVDRSASPAAPPPPPPPPLRPRRMRGEYDGVFEKLGIATLATVATTNGVSASTRLDNSHESLQEGRQRCPRRKMPMLVACQRRPQRSFV